MSEATIFVAAALAAVCGFIGLRIRRIGFAGEVSAAVGLLLLMGSVIAGVLLLPVSEVPPELPRAVGVLPPSPTLPRPGRGFAVSLQTQVNSCSNPVTVSLVAAGTAEYWADYRRANPHRRAGRYPFALVIPAHTDGHLRVGLATQTVDFTDPASAHFSHGQQVHITQITHVGAQTFVAGTVSDWPITLLPLLARFRADWLEPRGLSTCYLRLPAVSGSRTSTAAVGAVGGCRAIDASYRGTPCHGFARSGESPYVGPLLISRGASIVTVRSGEISPADSLPAPASLIDGHAAWTCSARPDSVGTFPRRAAAAVPDVVPGHSGGAAYSLHAIAGTSGSTCRAIAVITESSDAYSRDLVILFLGAAMGLGITLLVQGVIDAVAKRGGESAPEAASPAQRARPDDGGSSDPLS